MDAVESELMQIKRALLAVAGAVMVATAWPKGFGALPCVLVQLAGERGADRRDDAVYLVQLEWYVRVFARKREQDLLPLCGRVCAAMEALGYEHIFRWDDDSAEVCPVVFRFVKTI
ncbi:MAG: hypothetical protein RSG96_06220 [Clostridia bacterium]